MKTIAISIDERTLQNVDELVAKSDRWGNRSAVIRAAVQELAERERRRRDEERERELFHRHRRRLARQARALIADQARS
jgi:Arc/MetJ-type ribon-helix-helix transcriptional regulator